MTALSTTKEIYEKLIEMPDLHSMPKLDGDVIIWELYNDAYVTAYCNGCSTSIDVVSRSAWRGPLTHWHPDDAEEMLSNLYSLGKKGNIFAFNCPYSWGNIFYIGDPDKYRFDKNKKWYWGRLIYLEQK